MEFVLNLIDAFHVCDERSKNSHCRKHEDIIRHFLSRFRADQEIASFRVWTQCEKMKALSLSSGYQVFEDRLSPRVGSLNKASPQQWDQFASDTLQTTGVSLGDIRIFIDTRCLLLKPATIYKMCDLLLEDDQAHVIYPVTSVDPHLFMRYPKDNFFPVWDYPGLDRQKFPQLYRKVEAFSYHPLRPTYKQPLRERHHLIPWYEGKTYADDELMEFAKHMIDQQGANELSNG